jgi:hypothetical protein
LAGDLLDAQLVLEAGDVDAVLDVVENGRHVLAAPVTAGVESGLVVGFAVEDVARQRRVIGPVAGPRYWLTPSRNCQCRRSQAAFRLDVRLADDVQRAGNNAQALPAGS